MCILCSILNEHVNAYLFYIYIYNFILHIYIYMISNYIYILLIWCMLNTWRICLRVQQLIGCGIPCLTVAAESPRSHRYFWILIFGGKHLANYVFNQSTGVPSTLILHWFEDNLSFWVYNHIHPHPQIAITEQTWCYWDVYHHCPQSNPVEALDEPIIWKQLDCFWCFGPKHAKPCRHFDRPSVAQEVGQSRSIFNLRRCLALIVDVERK